MCDAIEQTTAGSVKVEVPTMISDGTKSIHLQDILSSSTPLVNSFESALVLAFLREGLCHLGQHAIERLRLRHPFQF